MGATKNTAPNSNAVTARSSIISHVMTQAFAYYKAFLEDLFTAKKHREMARVAEVDVRDRKRALELAHKIRWTLHRHEQIQDATDET